jgi:hypothetical protein
MHANSGGLLRAEVIVHKGSPVLISAVYDVRSAGVCLASAGTLCVQLPPRMHNAETVSAAAVNFLVHSSNVATQ